MAFSPCESPPQKQPSPISPSIPAKVINYNIKETTKPQDSLPEALSIREDVTKKQVSSPINHDSKSLQLGTN
jgi:hypothetical protein